MILSKLKFYPEFCSWLLLLTIDDNSCSWLFNSVGITISLGGLTAIGIESFHWTSPNWTSIGSVENWTVGCIATGCWGIDDNIRGFDKVCTVDFCWLLSKCNDCVGPSTNSYSSIDGEIICGGGGSSSLDCLDGKDVSLGIGWNEVAVVFVFDDDDDDDGIDLLGGFGRDGYRELKWLRPESFAIKKDFCLMLVEMNLFTMSSRILIVIISTMSTTKRWSRRCTLR